MRIAVTEAGMAFGYNPVTMTSFSPKLVRRHTDAVLNTNGGVFAYCATGRRRTMLWAFEFAHQRAPEDLIQHRRRVRAWTSHPCKSVWNGFTTVGGIIN
ncbi:MAG: hypothetical protein EBX06_00160 [Rhodobacteraceae bacterium]|jgi:uncharacterized protein (TIGR01244 family)|nr:hypothetical protein [Paracoccaceae bacterium]NCV29432.1 hypothetical protein [Paracoccaceae bacterium]NCV68076.1 hypothetical protein [Paracoccaceae bacterium]NCW64713.1 hypothetical protein [Paracoccaceae bacterium]NCX07739.1 hypothetical protein [Paracoccaceae bacterium]